MQKTHWDGAEEARRTHNPEVTGSNPVPGIFYFSRFIEAIRHSLRDIKQQHNRCGEIGSALGS